MSWCPKCKSEYREGFEVCSDCGSKLVEALETETSEEEEDNQEAMKNDAEALLISVSKEYEAKIIESKLTAFGVPSYKRYRGIDNIYGFANSMGIDVYVPSSLLAQAIEIIESQPE